MSKPVSKPTVKKVSEKPTPEKTEKPLATKSVKPSVKKLVTPKAVQPEKPKVAEKAEKKVPLAKTVPAKVTKPISKVPKKKGVSVNELITRMGMMTSDQFK